jgi:hypothetical protein
MKSTHSFHPAFLTAAAVAAVALSLVAPLRAQDTTTRHPITKDWITHHLVFSNPGTEEDAIKNGTYDHWLAVVNDPRYIMQRAERSFLASAPSAAPSLATADDGVDDDSQPPELSAPAHNGPLPLGLAKAVIAPPPAETAPQTKLRSHRRLNKDWSEELTSTAGTAGAAGATAGLGEFPATYTQSLGTAGCTDFAVYNTGLAGATTQPSIIAYDNIYTTCNSGTPTVYWAFNTGGTIVNSVAFYAPPNHVNEIGTQLYFVQTVSGVATLSLLKWSASGTLTSATAPTAETAANYYNSCSFCAAPCMTSVTFSGTGPATAPATGTFVVTGTPATSWANSTVTINSTVYTFVTGTPTAANQVELVTSGNTSAKQTGTAQNLEAVINASPGLCATSGCVYSGQTANTAVTATESTSTVSLTATVSGAAGDFTLASSNTSDVTDSVTNGTNGSLTDTYSAPYYDPSSDTIYVGDDVGRLHQFHPVFTGALAEIVSTGTSAWPATVNANASLGSPVFYNTGTATSSLVFVGDYPYNFASSCQPNVANSNAPCGYLYSVPSTGSGTSGTIIETAQLDYNDGIIDSPILDSSAGMVYAFVGQDNNATTTCNISSGAVVPCAGVYQFPVAFTSGATGTEAQVGVGSEFMMSGTFDNAYFISSNETGNMYVVGNTGPGNNTLFQIAITANVVGAVTVGPAVATNYTSGYYAAGLQVTEYYNGADYIFLSVLAFGNAAGCNISTGIYNGCVMGFNVTSGSISPSMIVTGALAEEGGTSGIVVDYATSSPAGSIYFSTLLNQGSDCTLPSSIIAGCGIQTSQSSP